jgi:hypothetical protein
MIVQKAVMLTGFMSASVGEDVGDAVAGGASVAVGSGVSVGGMGEGVNVGERGVGVGAHPLNKTAKNTSARNADRIVFVMIFLFY